MVSSASVPAAVPLGSASSAALPPAVPVLPSQSVLRPLGLGEVAIMGGFWADRQQVNARATLDHIEGWLEREGWLGNFDLVAGGRDMAARRGREFSDSEIYKYLEAVAWELGRRPDPVLRARLDAITARVAAAQDSDGYVNTKFGHVGQEPRYSDLEWGHELYCQGHLMQAAVACIRTGRADHLLVDVARRSADHVCATFGADGIRSVCGHAEIEVGLAELGRALGRPDYLEQARLFLERRGTHVLDDIEWSRSYYQDDMPIRDADVFRGHAVRANYLAAAAVDVASELDDRQLLDAVKTQWRNTMARRTYITGGQGSRHQDEGFGDDFALPPDRAYSETCASIGSNMVSWRLLLQTGGAEYADAMERVLFNVVATSPRDDGRAFYYANTLHQRVPGEEPSDDEVSGRALSSLRAPWFEVSCCPPNVARTLASLDTFMATADGDGIQIHQYAPMTIRTTLSGGEPVRLTVQTDYPRSGEVVVDVDDAPAEWTLSLRVPSWSGGALMQVGSKPAEEVGPGVVRVHAPAVGERIVLDIDVTPVFVRADPRIDAVRGCVAVRRGPEILCAESVDIPVPSAQVDQVAVDTSVAPREEGGHVVVRAFVLPPLGDHDSPYAARGEVEPLMGEVVDLPLVPYHRWARRGPSTMRVWLPEA